ncbi:MAG: hypothetical protein D6686_10175, partial [Alphaproteobacteria bacterium]
DFTEHVTTTTSGGGKGGGPKVATTEYSYSASFTIALCEGPITGIGRIWADGRLMDLSGVSWRWYPGDEAQLPDPFIEAKMGAGRTPAYRGTAYVVFEDLPLAAYGNRIPQLSFEVFRPLADYDTAEGLIRGVTMIPGSGEFVYATGAVRRGGAGTQQAENLHADRERTDFAVSLDRLEALAPSVESVSLVVSWFGNNLRAGNRTIRPGVEARRITTGAVRVTAESFPVAVAPEEAERRCRRTLMEAWTGRERASFSLPPSRLALDPGDVVSFTEGTATEFRLTRIADGLSRRIEATRQDREVYDLPPGAQRTAAVARSVPLGAPQVVLLDLPQLTSTHTPPRPLIAIDADPWPGTVAVLRSPEISGWASFATITRRARIGTLVTDLPTGPVWRWDRGSVLEISLPWGQLESVTDLQLFAVESAPGTWEILQARDVTLTAPGRYRLTTLLRGQRGTEHAIGNPAPAGSRVVVLEATVAELPFTAGEIGLPWNLAVGPASRPVSDPSYTTLSLTPAGASLRLFAPVHLAARAEPSGDITLTWTRRSRDPAANSWEAAEVPLLDQPEAWEIDILDGATVKRTLAAITAKVIYTPAEQVADWGSALAPGAALTIRVAQVSPSLGRGMPAETTVIIR